MTDRLSLYNRSLRHLGQRTLASLSENVEARRALDAAWDDGLVKYCLEQGQWNFAIRSVSLTYDPDVTPAFGFAYAFGMPSDWIRTVGLSSDEYFADILSGRRITNEGAYWYTDIDTLYLRYVSNDLSFGGDLSLWPETFTEYAALRLADQVCSAVTGSESKIERIRKDTKRALMDARSKDAINDGTSYAPMGSWAGARLGGRSRGDRGSRTRLIG
jgi:hypothetical protein